MSRKKMTFFEKYLASEKSDRQAFPTHGQSVETTPMDELCQLIFQGFIFF